MIGKKERRFQLIFFLFVFLFFGHLFYSSAFHMQRRGSIFLMGGFHSAGRGKNKKVVEISPLPAFWPERAKE